MNAISIQSVAGLDATPAGQALVARPFGIPGTRPPADWLPAPASARPAPSTRRARSRSATSQPARLLGVGTVPASEKLMLSLLVLAGALGIGYGFWCMLDLVEHWAGFTGGVARLIQ